MTSTKQVYLVTGGGSGFGKLMSHGLALEGHTVFASIHVRQGQKRPHPHELEAEAFAKENNVDLRCVPLDLVSTEAVNAGVAELLAATNGHLDVVVHNAGHMNFGPSEAFTAEQVLSLMDSNAVGMHRLNCAVLPHMRKNKQGHIIYISSTSCFGGKSALLGAYFGAKAAFDTMAQVYSKETNAWGIESTIVLPGIFGGTNHFTNAMQPGRPEIAQEYDAESAPTKDLKEVIAGGNLAVLPTDGSGDPKVVADAIVELSRLPRGKKTYRIIVDPVGDGSDKSSALVDGNCTAFMKRLGAGKYNEPWL